MGRTAGITTPEVPQEDIDAYMQWLQEGHHGELTYMENQIRCTPQELLPGAKRAPPLHHTLQAAQAAIPS